MTDTRTAEKQAADVREQRLAQAQTAREKRAAQAPDIPSGAFENRQGRAIRELREAAQPVEVRRELALLRARAQAGGKR